MVNNIDLESLDQSGNKLSQLCQNYDNNKGNTDQSESLSILSQIMAQIFQSKRELVRKEEEYSYAFGGFDNYSEEEYQQPSPKTQSLRAPEFNVFDSTEIPVPNHDEEEDTDELIRLEKEIRKWKGISKEMSIRLKESKKFSIIL